MQHLDDRQHSSTRYQNVQSIDQRIEFVRLVRIHELFRLERLTGNRRGQHSIRINDQWRLCFAWKAGRATNVEIVDYH